uniref:Uncharacterized protein n=1 Tax=Setaria italica TaxID=4555 RepID=K4A4I6_SETIT
MSLQKSSVQTSDLLVMDVCSPPVSFVERQLLRCLRQAQEAELKGFSIHRTLEDAGNGRK